MTHAWTVHHHSIAATVQLPEPSMIIGVGLGLLTLAVIAWVRGRRATPPRRDEER